MALTLKNVKLNHRMSEETSCFSATIYWKGVRVGTVCNRGTGGPNEFAVPSGTLAVLEKYADENYVDDDPNPPDWVKDLNPTPADKLDFLIDQLVSNFERDKQLAKWCKKRTLFRLTDTPANEWRTVESPYCEAVKKFLVGKYGDKIVEIANERLA